MAGVSQREARKAADRRQKRALEEQSARSKLVSRILKKPEELRTKEDLAVLAGCVDTVQAMEKRKQKREAQKRKLEEVLDEPDELKKKIKLLVTAVQEARYLVIYSGAGISTAASIPDYRGPNGVWTSLQSGRAVSATDLSEAEPTLTHMCIAQLYKEKLVQHVVSQNCDGLHLRSSLPRKALSELHGNMYIEVCTYCTPNQEYVRLFDVTERTSLHRHSTGRRCHKCANEMRDTIVHFGEKGTLEQPLNWKGAAEAAKKADVIICLGSSLKWTPKDDFATLKIHAKCDDVMKLIMEEQGIEIPSYDRFKDPIFSLATQLRPDEEGSHTRKILAKDNSGSVGTILSGGWYGKGCAKGRRRKKITA
ncbi:NAD-dependent protein deacetylase sirtuin-7 isoform X2 [Callorhinchus milii]|uniref:protein acetyllysine N-acetyltransferase n=1 Tax=Callorhinchus milii TaxID=7868 RepID=A0A4W3JSQ4_CALMI|nr:NAD-dependent protein deacetylase sirtuin-7 isoform X2 [Callorhinchus milii]